MTVKKIGGPGSTPVTGPEEPGGKPSAGVREAFKQSLQASPAGATAAGLEGVVMQAVEAVRRGDLEPDRALESILESSRQVLASELPAEVDMEDVLQYIRETLEGDPTFLSLLEGTAPSGT